LKITKTKNNKKYNSTKCYRGGKCNVLFYSNSYCSFLRELVLRKTCISGKTKEKTTEKMGKGRDSSV